MDPSAASESGDFEELYRRARAGDNAAWDELFRKCYPKVIRVVRRKLDRPLRAVFDSTDFASDVMKSLAANADRLDFPSLGSLLAFLEKVAEQKVIDEHRKAHTLKRDVDRQRRLDPGEGDSDGDGPRTLGLASLDPTASQVAQAGDAQARLMEGLIGSERTVIELKQQGYSNAEIATRTGWHPRKIQRFFKDLWDWWGVSSNAS